MKRDSLRTVSPVALVAALVLPATAVAQEDCVDEGNRNTRSAEVEFSLAADRNDTRPPEERYRRALEKLEENWTLDDVPARSYLLAANAYLELRDLVGADSMLTILVEEVPACEEQAQRMRFNAWVTQYNAGIEAMGAGEEDKALERFETANMINEDARSLAYAGSIHQQRGNNERAAELYEMALDKGGQDEIVRTASINLASLKQQEGDTEGALEIYEEYSNDNPDDVLGRLNFAIALMDADRQDEAQEIFAELMNRDDLTFNQWSQVGIGLYRAQNFEQAAQAFANAHEMNPYNKETLENLANAYYQSDQHAETLPLAEILVERYPLERGSYNLLVEVHRAQGEQDAALSAVERRDANTIEILRSQLTPMGETSYSVDGQAMNRTAEAGTMVSMPVILLGEEGEEVARQTLEFEVPAEGETTTFSLQIESEAPVAGFRYEVPAS